MKNSRKIMMAAIIMVSLASKAAFASNEIDAANLSAENKNFLLKLEMKSMGRHIKAVAQTISNSNNNAKNIQETNAYIKSAQNCKSYLPGGVGGNAERKALYEEMMDHSIELGQYLIEALKKNDQSKAKNFLAKIRTIEDDGHKEFGEDDRIFDYTGTLAAPEYKQAMKVMGIDLKMIAAQVGDATQNSSSVKFAEEFVTNAILSKTFIPDSISKLPAEEQPARMSLYNKMNDDCINLGKQLLAAFQKNDNASAAKILKSLDKNKKDSHYEFN